MSREAWEALHEVNSGGIPLPHAERADEAQLADLAAGLPSAPDYRGGAHRAKDRGDALAVTLTLIVIAAAALLVVGALAQLGVLL